MSLSIPRTETITRKMNESIVAGDYKITVVKIKGDRVRLGIEILEQDVNNSNVIPAKPIIRPNPIAFLSGLSDEM